MKINIKKASVKFWKICCIFNILCRFLSLPQISDYHHLKHSIDYTDLNFELALFCCLFTERYASKLCYDIQNIWFYYIPSEMKSTKCT